MVRMGLPELQPTPSLGPLGVEERQGSLTSGPVDLGSRRGLPVRDRLGRSYCDLPVCWRLFLCQNLPIHPALRLNPREPIRRGRDPPQIFFDVLFSHIPHWNLFSLAVSDSHTEQPLCEENSLGMMAKRAMPEVRKECLRFVKPVVDRQIIFRFATKFLCAILGMFKRVGHGYTSYVVVVQSSKRSFRSMVIFLAETSRTTSPNPPQSFSYPSGTKHSNCSWR